MSNYYMVPRRSPRFRRFGPVSFNGGRLLPVDVRTESDEYVITAAVPGLKPEDLKVEILNEVVTLRGEYHKEENGDGDSMLQEIAYGSFSRSLRLPEPLEAENANAEMENGVLTVRIPKSEAARPKTIEVKAR